MLEAMGIAAAVAAAWLVWIFNRLVSSRNQVRAGWSDIDVQLQRRHDLVPQLVAAVKGYAAYEKTLLESVTALRTRAQASAGPAQRAAVETALEQQLGRVLALRESYPDLKANQNFQQLQVELVKIEEYLQHARRFYNGAVRELNTRIETFPDLLVARSFGFTSAEFFEADGREAPVVNL